MSDFLSEHIIVIPVDVPVRAMSRDPQTGERVVTVEDVRATEQARCRTESDR